MDEVFQKLQVANRKVVKLEHLIIRLLEEQAGLQKELELLKEVLDSKDQENAMLSEKYEAAKLAKSISSEADRAALHDKIDNYLKEIDICLKKFGVQE